MRKTKSEALWNELSDEQRETLDKWLFDENLSYAEAWARARKELRFKGSLSSLKRYGLRRQDEKSVEDLEDLGEAVAKINGAPADEAGVRKATMKVVGGFVLRSVQRSPEKTKQWAPAAQLMVQNDYNNMLREAKGEERRIRRDAIAFAKERFRFDAIERALKALPQLLELAEARKDPKNKGYEENRRWNEVLRVMFGASSEVYPESAQEEAEMLAALRQREGAGGAELEKITEAQPPVPSSPYYEEYVGSEAQREEVEKAPNTNLQAPEKLQDSSSNGDGEQGAQGEEEVFQEEGNIENPKI